MLRRFTYPTSKPAAFVAGGVLALTTLTGCSSGPLETKCSEFMEMPATEQAEIITAWNEENGMGGPLSEFSAESDLASFKTYCGDQDHADDKVKDLTMTFG